MSRLRKSRIGINPIFIPRLFPDINVGVSIRILEDTVNYLPRSASRWNYHHYGQSLLCGYYGRQLSRYRDTYGSGSKMGKFDAGDTCYSYF